MIIRQIAQNFPSGHSKVRRGGKAELRNTCDAKKYNIVNEKRQKLNIFLKNYVGKNYLKKLLEKNYSYKNKLHICIR